MSYRKLDCKNNQSIETFIKIVEQMIEDLEILLSFYATELPVEDTKKEIEYLKRIIQKYKNQHYKISGQITDDYLTAEVVNYYHLHKHYPANTSQTEKELLEVANMSFSIEDKYMPFVAEKWNQYLTNPNEFNPNNFRLVVHAGSGILKLPGHPNYVVNELRNNTDISASLITDNHLELFQNCSVALSLRVDASNFISADIEDCATVRGEHANINTVKKIGNTYIKVGHAGKAKPPNTLSLPQTILTKNKKLPFQFDLYNEIVLDKTTTVINGSLFIMGGHFQFYDFVCAKKMAQMYGVPFIIIPKTKTGPLVLRETTHISECITMLKIEQGLETNEILAFIREYLTIVNLEENTRKIIEDYLTNIEDLEEQNRITPGT